MGNILADSMKVVSISKVRKLEKHFPALWNFLLYLKEIISLSLELREINSENTELFFIGLYKEFYNSGNVLSFIFYEISPTFKLQF